MGLGTTGRRVLRAIALATGVGATVAALVTAAPVGAAGATSQFFSANPASVHFGNVPLHSTVSRTIALTVDSGYIVSTAYGTGAAAPFGFFLDGCVGTFGPAVCNVEQTFTPTTTGLTSGTTHLEECPTAGGLCILLNLPLSGTGVTPQGFSASPSSLDFGDVPLSTTVTRSVTMTVNAGYLVIRASVTSAPFGFTFGTCIGFFGPGTCTVEESFTPANTGRAFGSTTVSECPSAGGPCISTVVTVTGRSGTTPSAVFSVSPNHLTFAQRRVGTTSVSQSVVVRDSGTGPLSFAQISISGDFLRSGGTCSTATSVPAGTSCTVMVTFAPHARGTRNGSLTFRDNSGTSPESLSLRGTGL